MKTVTRAAPRVDETREAFPTMTVNGRHVEHGTELTIAGIRGRCTFLRHVRHVNGKEWIDVIHGRTGRSRTVRPDAVVTVHVKRKVFAAAG